MKLMVQCPQVNHHLFLPLRELTTCDEDFLGKGYAINRQIVINTPRVHLSKIYVVLCDNF